MGQWSTPPDAPFVIQIRQNEHGWVTASIGPNPHWAPDVQAKFPPITLLTVRATLLDMHPTVYEGFKKLASVAAEAMMQQVTGLDAKEVKSEFRDPKTGRKV